MTAPPVARSIDTHNIGPIFWLVLHAFLKYPSVVPTDEQKRALSSSEELLMYANSLFMRDMLPMGKALVNTCRQFTSRYVGSTMDDMDKYERRRLRLLELRDGQCNRSVAELARRIARDCSYVSRMLYIDGKAGKKRIADDMMEVIETAFDLPRGWMDRDPGDGLSTPGPTESSRIAGRIAWADPQTQELIDLIKDLCPTQRGEVFGYARRVAENSAAARKANAAR